MKKLTVKKTLLYLIGLTLLGVCVTLIQQTNLGMSTWDAFYRNLYVGIPLEYKYLNPIVSVFLITFAYLLQKRKASLWMLFPLVISFYVGVVIDTLLLVVPSVTEASVLWNLGYLAAALIVCAIGLNLILYCKYPLPALDELCLGISQRLHTTFGKGKLIGEGIALTLTIIVGILFSHYSVWFYIGPTTIIFALLIGYMVDLFHRIALLIKTKLFA
ncbi:MAG: hypothetical protein KJ971_06395 [Firmicutes bacterium]|nr:hypothetical protein [Bacillota bacterium]